MKVFRYENTKEEVNALNEPVIFLAGPTVRGHQEHLQPSWRFEAIEIFEKLGFQGALIVPEFASKTESDKGRLDIPLWEYNGLKKADCILFWIPRTKELIALTTNWEHGYWFARDINRVILGYPPLGSENSYRNGYIDIMYREINKELDIEPMIYNTLEETIKASIKRSESNFIIK